MTVRSSPEALLLDMLCCPELDPDPRAHGEALLVSPRLSWGQLLEQAIEHKLLCVLADYLATTGLDTHAPRQMRRFLASTLRANQHKTYLYRREAGQVFRAFANAGIVAVALNGIALESGVYGGLGARQLSDIDILIAPDDMPHARVVLTQLAYSRTSECKANTFMRPLNDTVLPSVTVDLTTRLADTEQAASVRHIIHADSQEFCGLPVLSSPMAIQQALGRLGHELRSLADGPRLIACADALRLSIDSRPRHSSTELPESLIDAWNFLRQRWPHLNAVPGHVSGELR